VVDSQEPLPGALDDRAGRNPETAANTASLTNQAIDVFNAYHSTGQRELLDRAVALFRAALAAAPEGHPDRTACLSNLVGALRALFECIGEREVLVEAVRIGLAAVEATATDHPDRAGLLNNLGSTLQTLFERTGQLEVLVEAVAIGRAAVDGAPINHPDRAMYLNSLGITLQTLFGRTGQLEVLVEAVAVGRAAVDDTPADQPARAGRLNNLGLALRTLFEHTGQLDMLVEAVAVGRAAVDDTPADQPARAIRLNSLGITLQTLFGRTGELEVLVEAVAVGRAAVVATPASRPHSTAFLNNLGLALRTLFERTGELDVLVEAVAIGRAAVDATPTDHSERASHLNNLGTALRTLFERTGELEVLVEAVAVGREAVDATPADHPDSAAVLNNLGLALRALFERIGELDVLVEAVAAGRAAVDATPTNHPDRAMYLHNLGGELQALFGRTGELYVLVEAVTAGRAVVDATPTDHSDRAGRLNNLGLALRALSERTEEWDVLVEAVAVGRAAVDAAAPNHPDRAMSLNNLGNALQALFGRTGELEVLVEAVAVGRAAVDATPANHPDRASYLYNLGNAMQVLSGRTGELGTLAEARGVYREAASSTTGATYVRIRAYRQLALLAEKAGDSQDGLRCVEAAIDLVQALAPGSLARADREHQLGELANLAGEAAAAALNAGRPARAVELLERARGILAAETLGLHPDEQTRLGERRPDLAGRLERLRNRLDALDQPLLVPRADTGTQGETAQQATDHDRRLADRRREAHAAWQALLEEIRAVPGFADFFHAPPISTLARHAHDRPVVFVTTSPTRADVLILTDTPDPVQVVPLAGLNRSVIYDQANRLLAARRTADTRDLHPGTRQAAQGEILEVLGWLWDTIAGPVLTHLGHTTAPIGDTPWPQIWWCPVGVIAFLPLHAAGHHGPHATQPVRPRSVPDLVVSSYTPTVRAMANARAPRPDTTTPTTSTTLIVPVPDLPGAELPGVTAETNAIITLIPDAFTLSRPTRATVLDVLPTHRIAHFSCHGYADWEQPARSRLILTDHATTPLTVTDITALHLDADLAYLSACDTAVTAPRLADESLHITGAFHLAGYRHVIGTLWPINDQAAAQIAHDFYTHLTNHGTIPPNPDHCAHALHHATNRLRSQYPATPTLWAAHIHTGA
jgi:tetratricopeptide (TPR) repeat protein